MPENTAPVNPIIEQAASVIAKTELDMPWADLVRQCPDDADWYRNAARALADAGLLRTEPAVHPADVPQPGDRVQVTWRRTGTSRESVVDERGYYEGKSAVLMYPDTVTVEVIEPAPAADVQCCYAGRAAYPDPCPWHPADTGKETDR